MKPCLILVVCLVAARVSADPPGAGWVLTFSDEFNNQSSYDTNKWSSKYVSGAQTLSGNGELEWYVNSPQNIDLSSGSTLRLTALKNNPTNGFTYSSGMLSSHYGFNQAFGYFECRAKVPAGKGLWPAFWCLEGPKEGSSYWPPEIDFMEAIGAAKPKTVYLTNHYGSNYPLDGGTPYGRGSQFDVTQDLALGFHKYAVLWEPDKITWYVDDIERYSTATNVPYLREMHVILNLAVGGYWPGNPDTNTVFPAVFEVDYVRVYSKPLPRPWQAADIGSPSATGRTYAASSGVFNVCGAGSGMTGTNDQLQFAYLPLTGDGTLIARLKNMIGTHSISVPASTNAAAGLMIRESLAADARHVFVGGNRFSYRSATGGDTIQTNLLSGPSWLKLVRTGTLVTGFGSPDGVTWSETGSATVSMASTVYAGLAVTASAATKKATAQFDNIAVTGAATPVLTSITLSPASAMVEPGSTQPFAATALDQFGNAMNPPPGFVWSVAAGGTLDAAGWFTAGSLTGGPYTVTASSGTVTGSAPVTIVNTPNAPSGLTATTATMLNGWIKLTWTDNSKIETGYRVENLNGTMFTTVATVGSNVTTYTRTGLSMPSGPYTYRVLAIGAAGDSAYSGQVSASLPAPPPGPTGLRATPATNKVALAWTAVTGANNYNIQRSLSSTGGFSVIKYNNSSASYADTNVTAGTTYYYEVNYNSNAGGSLYSAPVSATLLTPFQTWQTQFFGAFDNPNAAPNVDADGTGQNNLFKYTAGLDPTNLASVFTLTVASPTDPSSPFSLTFKPIVAGRTYTPQWSTDLVQGVWLPLTGYAGPVTNGNQATITDLDTKSASKFYRIDIAFP